MEKDGERVRPVAEVRIVDERGYAYLPKILRREVGAQGKGPIPAFIDANCVLLVRKDATLADILKGLEVLKQDLILRSKKTLEE